MTKLKTAASIALNRSLGLKKDEKVLIITDNDMEDIGEIFYDAAREKNKTNFLKIPIPKVSGTEPAVNVSEEMKKHDVIVAATTKSLTHTNAVKEAAKRGARVASMPGITKDIMERCISIDYKSMAKRTNEIKDILDKGSEVRITTKDGADLRFSIKDREAKADSGILKGRGLVGNLPAGEAFIAPVEGTADGKYIIDGSILHKKVDKPIMITVKKGLAVRIDDGKIAEELITTLKEVKDKDAYNIAEIGIGTNDKAIITGNVLEDEKVLGTAHIALGKNSSFGGTIDVPVHLDGVFKNPTIYIDDEMVMEDGKLT
ncbi:aminopeptidase [Candidatus Woesearchaeota archaeon]|nr:aminopeptidase [Candidatus Woesearchaeota archaeon]